MHDVTDLLRSAAEEVLETMFYTVILNTDPVAETATRDVAVQVQIEGSCPGTLELDLPVETARRLGAALLGADESDITDVDAQDAAAEIANMICGATLSRWEGGGRFSLAKSTSATAPAAGNRARGTLPSILIPEGRLALEIRLD